MPPSNSPSTLPSHTAFVLSRATEIGSSNPNATPIIIGVSAGVGSLVLLVVVYKLWRSVTQRSKVPLPPKGPLAHHRQRQMAAYPHSNLDYPRSMDVPPQSTTSVGAVQFRDGIRQLNEHFDNTSIPPTPSVVSSQVQLVRTPTGSEENSDTQFSSHVSFNNSTPTRHHRSYKQRRFSAPSSMHSGRSRQSSASGTIRGRGPPHARHSRVDVILPQPLAPRLYHGNNASGHSQLSYGERRSESREDYETNETPIHGLPAPFHEMHGHDFRQYPPSVPPPLPSHTSSLSPIISSPNVTDPPVARVPLYSQHEPSPERGPPPLPPPKDTPPRSSGRTRR